MIKTNVIQMAKFRASNNTNFRRTCNFSTVSDKGNALHGTAAFLVQAKRNGGIDAFITAIAQNAAENALQEAIKTGQRKFG
jgi:NADH:ubiquinone oxidoreductase subunit 2 (subunit N)